MRTEIIGLVLVASLMARPALGQDRDGVARAEDGAEIHFIERGSGTPIVFVPGWTMPADIWRPQLRFFGAQFRAIAIDPRSQGASSQMQEGLDSATRGRDIGAVISHLKLTSVVLVAWSQAVTEAMAYVDQFGTRDLAGLVLVDGVAGGEFDARTVGEIVRALGPFQSDRVPATKAFVRSMFRTSQSETYLDELSAASRRTSTAAAIAMAIGALTADHQAALMKVDKPCLIVAPSQGMVDTYRVMRDRIPNARLALIDDAGHAVFVDAADRFNQLVLDFIRSDVARP